MGEATIEEAQYLGSSIEVYKTFFSGRYLARSALGANGLALGAQVEVECIVARTGGIRTESSMLEPKQSLENSPRDFTMELKESFLTSSSYLASRL
jgi:hypothetical protein